MENYFWKNKNVFITGHTGFKGSWLSLWLHDLGANVTGYALNPPTNPSLFDLAKIGTLIKSTIGDVRDKGKLFKSLADAQPDIVFHLAAQPLVRDSYKIPVDTYEINVMGTVNILEAVRQCGKTVRAFVNVTTDKVYENHEWCWGYRENEHLGGFDPYSNSKACSELVTSAYRNSYFNPVEYSRHRCAIASARAGNVIGGGDWAPDRLIPDCIQALLKGSEIVVRNPNSIRPWQHVLEPLNGYMLLAQKLFENGENYSEGWNFGPKDNDVKNVGWIVNQICKLWGENASYSIIPDSKDLHEATFLKLDCSKAMSMLSWYPRWSTSYALEKTISWVKEYSRNNDMRSFTLAQIHEYNNDKAN